MWFLDPSGYRLGLSLRTSQCDRKKKCSRWGGSHGAPLMENKVVSDVMQSDGAAKVRQVDRSADRGVPRGSHNCPWRRMFWVSLHAWVSGVFTVAFMVPCFGSFYSSPDISYTYIYIHILPISSVYVLICQIFIEISGFCGTPGGGRHSLLVIFQSQASSML